MVTRAACVLIGASLACGVLAQDGGAVRRVRWGDVAALREVLEADGITPGSFDAYVDRVREANGRRIREGDLDHLVFYLLQSTRFTSAPPIEPALSAKAFVERLPPAERDRFLRAGATPAAPVPPEVRARIAAFLRAMHGGSADPRLTFFRELAAATFPASRRERDLAAEYMRAMRFLYQKEFGARAVGERMDGDPVAELYRSRGLSTDTAVEAGYLVYTGLGIARGLDPGRRVKRVLIVGPGLDLAPRTAFDESAPPESYQPWAVMDALVALGASTLDELEVVAADINPRVVAHLQRSRTTPPQLGLVGEIRETDTVRLTPEYREYFSRLGRAIGAELPLDAGAAGELRKTVRIAPAAAAALHPVRLDIVTERLTGPPFDLAVATNILPYFDDRQLALAMSNVAGMLGPGGVLIHNEARPVLQEITDRLGLPFRQSRHAVIATVRGAPAPLFDSVFLHGRK